MDSGSDRRVGRVTMGGLRWGLPTNRLTHPTKKEISLPKQLAGNLKKYPLEKKKSSYNAISFFFQKRLNSFLNYLTSWWFQIFLEFSPRKLGVS